MTVVMNKFDYMDKANHKLPHDPWCIKETGQRLPNDATTAKFYVYQKYTKKTSLSDQKYLFLDHLPTIIHMEIRVYKV